MNCWIIVIASNIRGPQREEPPKIDGKIRKNGFQKASTDMKIIFVEVLVAPYVWQFIEYLDMSDIQGKTGKTNNFFF